jgi:UDP-N-acetylmuramyl pentapeptide phosphotransferase/UDP-N-acetylglucosamine-1-phosphate transferase
MLPAIIVTFVVAALLAWLLTRARGHWLVLDIPNERSLHTHPIPRTGGVAIPARECGRVHGLASGLRDSGYRNGYRYMILALVAGR